MPTIRTVTVKSSGGDYSTLAAAEAGEQGNLVTLDRQLIIECYPMEDTTAVTVDGYTVDAARNIIIRTPATDWPNGVWTTSAYRLVTATGATSLSCRQDYTVIDGLQVANTGTASTDDVITVYQYRNYIKVVNCVVKGGYHGIMAVVAGANGAWTIANNVVYGTYSGGIRYSGSSGKTSRALNNTVYGCNTGNVAYRGGIENEGSYQEAANNLSIGNNGYCFKQATGQSYNISSDATAAGTGSLTNKSLADVKLVSATAGAEDLHIQSGSVAIGAGTDLSAYITADIDGQTRSVPWDIGADQYVVAGGTAVTITHDMRSVVASNASASHDMRAAISSGVAQAHDTTASISTAVVNTADALAMVYAAVSTAVDAAATVATDCTTQSDASAIVQSQVSAAHDTGAAVSTATGITHDLAAGVSSAIAVSHDTTTTVAAALTQLHDTLADVATYVGYVVNHDTRAIVDTQLTSSHDLRVAVASAVSMSADVLAVVAVAVDRRHATATTVATQVAQAADTLAAISRQIVIAHDLRAMVSLAGESAAILGDVVTLMTDYRLIRLSGDPHIITLSDDRRLIRLPEAHA